MLIFRREAKGIIVFNTQTRQYYFIEAKYAELFYKIEKGEKVSSKYEDLLLNCNLLRRTKGKLEINGKTIFHNKTNSDKLSAPIIVFLQVTDKCNLKCKHCFTGNSRIVERQELSLKEIQSLFKRFSQSGVFEVVIGGGEPFVRKDIIDILRFANSMALTPSITTNGTILSDQLLSELQRIHLGYLKISLDGAEKEHDYIRGEGTFKKSVDTLQKLIDSEIPTGVRMVVNAHNYKSILPLYRTLLDVKCPSLSFSMIRPSGNALCNKELYDNLSSSIFEEVTETILKLKAENQMKISLSEDAPYVEGLNDNAAVLPELLPHFGCSIKGTVCEIDAGGDMTPCGFLKNLIGRQLIGGNIRKNDYIDIWNNSDVFSRFRRLKMPKLCQDCVHVHECHGGCRTRAYYSTGQYNEADPLCYYSMRQKESFYNEYYTKRSKE